LFGKYLTGPFYGGPYYATRPRITPVRAGVKRADKVGCAENGLVKGDVTDSNYFKSELNCL